MLKELQGRRIAILAADGVERVELEEPRAAVEKAGGAVEVLSIKAGEIQARNHDLEPAGSIAVDRTVGEVEAGEGKTLRFFDTNTGDGFVTTGLGQLRDVP